MALVISDHPEFAITGDLIWCNRALEPISGLLSTTRTLALFLERIFTQNGTFLRQMASMFIYLSTRTFRFNIESQMVEIWVKIQHAILFPNSAYGFYSA